MKKLAVIAAIATLLIIGGVALRYHEAREYSFSPNPAFAEELSPLKVGTATIRVAVADTNAERTQGLSSSTDLPRGYGMLFVFENEGLRGFWMKDMLFPIDILWISAAGEIVHIEHSVSPDTYPTVLRPEEKAQYVLEVPAGFSVEHDVKKGMKISVEMVAP